MIRRNSRSKKIFSIDYRLLYMNTNFVTLEAKIKLRADKLLLTIFFQKTKKFKL